MTSQDLLIDRNYWSYLLDQRWNWAPADLPRQPLPGIPGFPAPIAPQGLVSLPGCQGDDGPQGPMGDVMPGAELTPKVEEFLATGVVLDWDGLLCVYHELDEDVEQVHGLPIGQRLSALLQHQPNLAPSPPGLVYLRTPDGRSEGWTLPVDHPVFDRETVAHTDYVNSRGRRLFIPS